MRTLSLTSSPHCSVRSVMQKYLEKENEISFDKLFNQILGYLLFKDFCESMSDEPVPQLKFYEEVRIRVSSLWSSSSVGKQSTDRFSYHHFTTHPTTTTYTTSSVYSE